jgi:hypothetical protein
VECRYGDQGRFPGAPEDLFSWQLHFVSPGNVA